MRLAAYIILSILLGILVAKLEKALGLPSLETLLFVLVILLALWAAKREGLL